MSKAGEMFDAYVRHQVLESEIGDDLIRACGVDPHNCDHRPFTHITYDDYDNSFEFKGVKDDWCPTEEQLAACWALGFSRCWICQPVPEGQHRGPEKFFYAPALYRVFPGEPEASTAP